MRAVIVSLAALILGTGVALTAPVAFAQTDQDQDQAQPQSRPQPLQKQPSPHAAISDQKLDAAAAAMQQVAHVRQDYRQKIQSAEPKDQERLASEGNAALEKAVTDHGLSIDEYNSILTVAQNDPSIRARLMQRLQGAQGAKQ